MFKFLLTHVDYISLFIINNTSIIIQELIPAFERFLSFCKFVCSYVRQDGDTMVQNGWAAKKKCLIVHDSGAVLKSHNSQFG